MRTNTILDRAASIKLGVIFASVIVFATGVPSEAATSWAQPRDASGRRSVRVVIDGGRHFDGTGPVQVERGRVVFRLTDGLLVSVPIQRVDRVIPATHAAAAAAIGAAFASAIRLGDTAPPLIPGLATFPADEPPIVISNGDLPPPESTPYYYTAPESAEMPEYGETEVAPNDNQVDLDEVYWQARMRGLADDLREAERRVQLARQQIDALTRFADQLSLSGSLPDEVIDEMAAAEVELARATSRRDDLLSEWEQFKEESRSAAVLSAPAR